MSIKEKFTKNNKFDKTQFERYCHESYYLHLKQNQIDITAVNQLSPGVKDAFLMDFVDGNQQMLELLGSTDSTICTVVFDKAEHWYQYGRMICHPYHVTLIALLESYVDFLHKNNAKGYVMAEARGGKEDKALEEVYKKFYQYGTKSITPDYIQAVLSPTLTIKRKSAAIAGLEIADLLTRATKIDVLHTFEHIKILRPNFQTCIIEKIQSNYHQEDGTSKGFGKKLLYK